MVARLDLAIQGNEAGLKRFYRADNRQGIRNKYQVALDEAKEAVKKVDVLKPLLETDETRQHDARDKAFAPLLHATSSPEAAASELRSISAKYQIPKYILLGVAAREMLPGGQLNGLHQRELLTQIGRLMAELVVAHETYGSWDLALMRFRDGHELRNPDIGKILIQLGRSDAEINRLLSVLRGDTPADPNHPIGEQLAALGLDPVAIKQYVGLTPKVQNLAVDQPLYVFEVMAASDALADTFERAGVDL